MWNWLMSGLASGATLVLFDGSPTYPAADSLWQMAEEEGIAVFGTSARYLSSIEKLSIRPAQAYQLPQLRMVLSTGSPLSVESFRYVYREIKADVCLASISGGTDILSCFALGNPCLPVFAGELQCMGLGMDVDVFNDQGQPIRERKGELVCTSPFPSMPTGFWQDDNGDKYRTAYFERFPGIWCQGDYAEITINNGIIIHGRSDAILNPGGVRIGTAEIYRQVEKVDVVVDSICIGPSWEEVGRVVVFVVLRPGAVLDDALVMKIRGVIRAETTARHVPAIILQVDDIPRTISGKITELAVRNIVHHQPVNNTDALANPAALECFRDRPELEI
jgi:acetoacetyl-CoA synthetase